MNVSAKSSQAGVPFETSKTCAKIDFIIRKSLEYEIWRLRSSSWKEKAQKKRRLSKDFGGFAAFSFTQDCESETRTWNEDITVVLLLQ